MSDEPYDFEKEFQAVFIPKQKPPPARIVADEMGATVSSYPPLGQVTQVKDGNLNFIVLLEVEEKDAKQPWEIALWHSYDGGEWAETILSVVDEGPTPSSIQAAQNRNSRFYFNSRVSVSSSLSFTFKFRNGPDHPWRWTRDEQSIGDGTIIVNTEMASRQMSTDFSNIIKDFNSDLKVKSVVSQCPGTELWSLEAPVGPASGEEAAYADIRVGSPWGGFLR